MFDSAGQLVAISRVPASLRLALVCIRVFMQRKVCRRNVIGQMLVKKRTIMQLAFLSSTWLFVHLKE